MAKILIVEDNKDILYTNRMMLELNGYEVLSAETLDAAETVFRENGNIALILLDIMLPDGSGLDWCRALRKNSDVKILFLSALDTNKDVIAGFRAGGDDYLEKPYHMEELLLRAREGQRVFCAAEDVSAVENFYENGSYSQYYLEF